MSNTIRHLMNNSKWPMFKSVSIFHSISPVHHPDGSGTSMPGTVHNALHHRGGEADSYRARASMG